MQPVMGSRSVTPPQAVLPSALAALPSAEVESEQAAAQGSVLDVLEGFASLFGQPPFLPAPNAASDVQGAAAMPTPGQAGGSSSSHCADKVQAAGREEQMRDGAEQPGGSDKAAAAQHAPPADFWALLADVRSRVAAGQLLGAQPLLAMRQLLAAVQPQHLQHAIESQLPAADASAAASAAAAAAVAASAHAAAAGSGEGSALAAALQGSDNLELARQLHAATALAGPAPPFSLVTPKLATLAGELMQYRLPAAAAAAGSDAADGKGAWCGILFVTQRMAAWALHKLLRQGGISAWACLLSGCRICREHDQSEQHVRPVPHRFAALAPNCPTGLPTTSPGLQPAALHPGHLQDVPHHGPGPPSGGCRLWLPGKEAHCR